MTLLTGSVEDTVADLFGPKIAFFGLISTRKQRHVAGLLILGEAAISTRFTFLRLLMVK